MPDEILILDAAGSNPDGTDPGSPLSIGPGTSYPMTALSVPAPPQDIGFTSSVDTEGEMPVTRRYQNRTISIDLEVSSDTTGALLAALQAKVAKLQREGGTLKRTDRHGVVKIYDLHG